MEREREDCDLEKGGAECVEGLQKQKDAELVVRHCIGKWFSVCTLLKEMNDSVVKVRAYGNRRHFTRTWDPCYKARVELQAGEPCSLINKKLYND